MRAVRTLIAVALGALGFGSAVFAQGHPLGCSDFVFVEPGLTCRQYSPMTCDSEFCRPTWTRYHDAPGVYVDEPASPRVLDNEGRIWRLHKNWNGSASELRLLRFDPTTGLEIIVGTIVDQGDSSIFPTVGRGGSNAYAQDGPGFLLFDDKNGRLLLFLTSIVGDSTHGSRYQWIAAIEGLTTSFEIYQSYIPDTGKIGFRVPVHPEGFERAEAFDTYWGVLSQPLDLAAARPLRCAYPAAPPNAGDYLTVGDTVPAPAPGSGVFFLTSVTRQGERRVGRKAEDGALRGRKSDALPPCVLPR